VPNATVQTGNSEPSSATIAFGWLTSVCGRRRAGAIMSRRG
jgi:hypothetical protein